MFYKAADRAPEYACHIGRVGALAVALGIGIAIANGSTATAWAAGAETSTGTSASSTAGAHEASRSETGSQSTSADTAPADRDADTEFRADHADADTQDAIRTDPADASRHDIDADDQHDQEASHLDGAADTAVDSAPDTDTDTHRSDAVTAVESKHDGVEAVVRQSVPNPAKPASNAVAEVSDTGSDTTGVSADQPQTSAAGPLVMSAPAEHVIGDDPSPSPPSPPTLLVLLDTLRREIEYRLFNKTPTIEYDSSNNTRNTDGQIVGRVDATDADGDTLTYTVLGNPWRGVVSVSSEGIFSYTPNAALAAAGGSDTFVLAVSDLAGNPAHIHGLSTFLAPYGGAAALARVTVLVDPPGTPVRSPLATAEQIAAEQLATDIVNHPLMQIAKVLLKAAWTMAAYQQFAPVGGPDAVNLAQLDQAVDEYALQAAFELQLLNPNNPQVIQQVMPPHSWYGQFFGGARILYDNPDTIYRMVPVNNSSSYVLHGRFGGEVPAETTFSVLTGLTGTTTDVLSGRDLVLAADGKSFTITVDARASDPDNPNHLQLPPGATLIAARNTLSDWLVQDPMSLSVQRIAGPPDNLFSQLGLYDIPVIGPALTGNPVLSTLLSIVPPLKDPPLELRAAETAIVMMLGVILEPQYMAVATKDATTGRTKNANELSSPAHNASFLATQMQSAGYFQLRDDEALVISINPGRARYFSVPVTNVWTVTRDYWNEPTSLNNAQATPNADGQTYTIVVSRTDAMVRNWVSTGGLNQGTLSIRFQDLDLDPALADPTVTARVVRLDSLLDEYPELSAQPADDTFRLAQQEVRRQGYAKRYAPYPVTT